MGVLSGLTSFLGLTFPPPAAIRRDPEASGKLEATVLRLRRDQKGSGWWVEADVGGVASTQI